MTGSEVLVRREGTRLLIALPKTTSAPRKPSPEIAFLGGCGSGKSMLFMHLASTAFLASQITFSAPRVYGLPFEDIRSALMAWDWGKVWYKTWDLSSSGPTCGNCSGGRNLEASLADFRRSHRFILRRSPSLITRCDLLEKRDPLSPFDPVPQMNDLFEDEPPSSPCSTAHPCTPPPLLFAREIHPDHQERLVRILKRAIRIILLARKLMAAYLRRLSHVPPFGLLMMAAILRYGHRHDSDDDLRFPLRRCMIMAGGATAI